MDFTPLFESRRLRLTPLDPERDAEVESRWTHDPDYLRLTELDSARPLSPAQVKKKYEALEKEAHERRTVFAFGLRAAADDRLLGWAKISRVDWPHGTAEISLALGAPEDRRQGLGSEALGLLLRYAFHELNLFRLQAYVPEYNPGALRLLERAGFQVEVRRRQALHRGGRRWDLLWLGLLREEWEAAKGQGGKEKGGQA